MPSPTARTLERLRRLGFVAGVVERWIHDAARPGHPGQQGIRKDLFGAIDVIACKPGEPILGVQATVLSAIGARLQKARATGELGTWLAAGGRFEVWGWAKSPDGRWRAKVVELRAGDVTAVLQAMPRKRRRSRWQAGDLFAGQ